MADERDVDLRLRNAVFGALGRGLNADSDPASWHRNYLAPALAEKGLTVVDSAEHAEVIRRAAELRDQARAVCVRRTAERDEALARLRIADREATFGRSVLALANEIMRLRSMMAERPSAFPTDSSPQSIAAVLAGELAEVARETPGSEAAQRESGDVFAAAVHLMLAHNACLLAEFDAVGSKIEARLDVMEDDPNCTWDDAKQAVQLSTN
jgi:NTP pyrophosphatase (non-canonical NTP hydrolase)